MKKFECFARVFSTGYALNDGASYHGSIGGVQIRFFAYVGTGSYAYSNHAHASYFGSGFGGIQPVIFAGVGSSGLADSFYATTNPSIRGVCALKKFESFALLGLVGLAGTNNSSSTGTGYYGV